MNLISGTHVWLRSEMLAGVPVTHGEVVMPFPGDLDQPDVGMVLVEWEDRPYAIWEYVTDLEVAQ